MLAVAVVIAGLDPAIHPVRKKVLTKRMDPRVKPAGDGGFVSRAAPHPALAALGPPSPRCRGAREIHRVRQRDWLEAHQLRLKPALRLLERSPVAVSLTEPV